MDKYNNSEYFTKQPDYNDNEPIVLDKKDETWEFVELAWKHIPIKYYKVTTRCGQLSQKRLLFINKNDSELSYNIICNMPHIVRIINSSIILQKEEGMYVRFQIIPPESGCILNVKLVFFDVK